MECSYSRGIIDKTKPKHKKKQQKTENQMFDTNVRVQCSVLSVRCVQNIDMHLVKKENTRRRNQSNALDSR